MHSTMQRLYSAAKDVYGLEGPASLSRVLNTSVQTVKNWESRGISRDGLISAQSKMGISIDWLRTGDGEMFVANWAQNDGIRKQIMTQLKGAKGLDSVESQEYLTPNGRNFRPSGSPNLTSGPAMYGQVPVISWVQAGSWTEIIDNFTPGDAEEWMPCPVAHSSSTFVLRVRGESMFNPMGRPSFQDGDLIFVDPERVPENGSLVVVRLEDSKEATFKKLIIEGDNQYLKPLNPAWPEPIIRVDENATICGVVIFKGEKL